MASCGETRGESEKSSEILLEQVVSGSEAPTPALPCFQATACTPVYVKWNSVWEQRTGEEGRMVREQSCGGPLGNRIRHVWGAGRCRAWPGVFWWERFWKTFVSGAVCEHFPWTWEHKLSCPWGPAPGIAGQVTLSEVWKLSSS